MQTFTISGSGPKRVTIQIEITSLLPLFAPEEMGYQASFLWWLDIDGVEYVSGETAEREIAAHKWGTHVAGWDTYDVHHRIDVEQDNDQDIEEEIEEIVAAVTDWFDAISNEIVGAFTNISTEYVERANEHGDFRPDMEDNHRCECGYKLDAYQPHETTCGYCVAREEVSA